MSLTNVEIMKETIGLSSYEDEWIHNSMVSTSPFGDFIVISSSTCAVFYIKKYASNINNQTNKGTHQAGSSLPNPAPVFQILRTYYPTSKPAGNITAVCYLPVKVLSASGRTQDMWHCVVVGYDSGLLEIVAAESGDVLVTKQFNTSGNDLCDCSVISIQYLATVSMSNAMINRSTNSYLSEMLAIPKMQELIIVMNSSLAVIESSTLFSAILSGKNELAVSRTNSSDKPKKPNTFSWKIYKVREQSKIVDAVAYAVPNVSFDQYHRISMNRDMLNEEHLRSLSYITTYVTVGSRPFIQHNSPHQLSPQNINELAANVVSTVKSGLFRAATGLMGSWGGGSYAGNNDEAVNQPDPESFLHVRHAFKDNSKTAVGVKMSPDGRYAAILDEHNRVLLLDNNVNGNGAGSGTLVHVWKGYHHAQIGWTTTSWEERKGDQSDKIPQDLEIGVLLVLYLPRRGLLEVWSPEQMFRVVEFPVGKHGKLISCTNALLDEGNPTGPLSVRTFGGCAFLEPSGIIKHIYVPVHSLTSKSSSHDAILRKQLLALPTETCGRQNDGNNGEPNNLLNLKDDQDTTSKIINLILSVKSTMGKIDMLIELFHVWETANSFDQRMVLEAVASQLSQSEIASQRCLLLHDLIEFYDFLNLKYEASVTSSDENDIQTLSNSVVQQLMDCSIQEADNFLGLFKHSNLGLSSLMVCGNQALSFAGFMSCFDFKCNAGAAIIDEGAGANTCRRIRLKPKSIDANMKLLCQYIANASFVDPKETLDIMKTKGIADGYTLINVVLNSAIKHCNMEDESSTVDWIKNTLASTIFSSICNLAFNLHETNGDGTSFQTLIQVGRQALMRNNPICLTTFAVTLAWKTFLCGGSKGKGNPRYKSYVEEWTRAMFLMEGFIAIASVAKEELQPLVVKYTLHDVFNSGDGRISEICVQWMLNRGIKLKDIISTETDEATEKVEVESKDSDNIEIMEHSGKSGCADLESDKATINVVAFMNTCKDYFPMSSGKDMFVCHMAWEYMHRWSKNHRQLDLFTDGGIRCLHWVPQAFVQHRLTALTWTTFVSKAAIEAVNLTENRASSRCERELGFHESQIAPFLGAVTKMLRILVDTADVDRNSQNDGHFLYDDVSLMINFSSGGPVTKKLHLMDHIRGKMSSSDTDVVAVQYQFVVVANAIWSFGIDSIKPLNLFNSQESNLFFQGSPSSSTFASPSPFQSLNLFQSEHSKNVKHCRRRFFEAACDGAVSCIHQLPNGKLDCKRYESWCNVLVLLGKMWHMPEKLREMQIISLYRAGHDSLGAELINVLSDRTSVAHKLLHLSLLRLSKHIYFGGVDGESCPEAEAKAKIASLTSTSSHLTKQLEILKNEASKTLSADVSLKDTSDLLVMLSGLELEEQSQQLAYECLAVSQSFR